MTHGAIHRGDESQPILPGQCSIKNPVFDQ